MRCSDPEALVTSWLAVPSRQPEHPLVVEVGELAILVQFRVSCWHVSWL
jgi:hypothetical protein